MSDRNLLLIPSPLVLNYSYHFLKPLLQTKFNLIFPHIPHRVWNEDKYAKWLFDFMNENGIEKTFIMGHSNSGSIAIRFAGLHPEKVEGVIVTDTIGMKRISVAKILWGRAIDAFIEWKLTLWGFYHLIIKFVTNPPAFLYQIWLSKAADVRESARNLKVPMLILWGRRDHTIPLEMGLELKRLVPHAKMYVSEKGSHDWILTHHDEVVKVIDEWTREVQNDTITKNEIRS